jgi:hypothetical protein
LRSAVGERKTLQRRCPIGTSGTVAVVEPSSADPYADAWERVADAILSSPGELSEDERGTIAAGGGPPELAPLLDKVRGDAYTIVDADIVGLDDDAALEAILSAALGAADARRRAALEALS